MGQIKWHHESEVKHFNCTWNALWWKNKTALCRCHKFFEHFVPYSVGTQWMRSNVQCIEASWEDFIFIFELIHCLRCRLKWYGKSTSNSRFIFVIESRERPNTFKVYFQQWKWQMLSGGNENNTHISSSMWLYFKTYEKDMERKNDTKCK